MGQQGVLRKWFCSKVTAESLTPRCPSHLRFLSLKQETPTGTGEIQIQFVIFALLSFCQGGGVS